MIPTNKVAKLLERDGKYCSSCGVELNDSNMSIDHIVPYSHGGDDSISNLRLMCQTCNVRISNRGFGGIRESDFTSYLVELMQLHEDYLSIVREKRITTHEFTTIVDIFVEDNFTGTSIPKVVEVKSADTYSTARRHQVVEQLKRISTILPNAELVFAIPMQINESDRRFFESEGIEVWDLGRLNTLFSEQIDRVPHPIFQKMFFALKAEIERPEHLLRTKLSKCLPGHDGWVVYQRLVGEIIDLCFNDRLSAAIAERSDESKTNRRDFIIPNYAENGFWSFLRNRYSADNIVVDAKNSDRKIRKVDALQIANYLKEHGVGLFGIIFSRKGPDKGCIQTLREVWAIERKLIVVLDDYDVEAMLNLFGSGIEPEGVIKQKIEDFRLCF